jgi:Zinc finger, C2H2 type
MKTVNCKKQCRIYIIMSENRENIAPSTNRGERPDLQDYKSTDKVSANTNTCQDCGKVFPSTEELTTHYKKDHPESF